MKKSLIKETLMGFLRLFFIMITCIIIGFLLMLAVYLIPVDKLWGNVYTSLETFEREGINFSLQNTPGTTLDNFTDSFMVTNVIYIGSKGSLDDAMSNYRVKVEGGNNIDALRTYLEGGDYTVWSYSRYWHGYIVLLKPLFLLFNYPQIRSINTFFHILLMFAICIALIKRNKGIFCIPLALTWYTLSPPTVMQSFQYSAIFNITFLACLAILVFHEYLENKRYVAFFLIVGALTSFIDLLTYPVLTISIPLTMILILRHGNSSGFKKTMTDIASYVTSWVSGYSIMWAGKWILSTILTERDVLTNALEQVKYRMGNSITADYSIAFATGLKKCADTLITRSSVFVMVICFFICILILIKNRQNISFKFTNFVPFILIAIIPVIWLLLTNNHTANHFSFTYRSLTATVFALYSGFLIPVILPNTEKSKETNT